LIGPKIPVHGVMIDTETGPSAVRLDTIDFAKSAGTAIGSPGSLGDFQYGEMKFPEMKIGDASSSATPATPPKPEPAPVPNVAATPPPVIRPATLPPLRPAKVPLPPPIRPNIYR
jgi:hypothetical protein